MKFLLRFICAIILGFILAESIKNYPILNQISNWWMIFISFGLAFLIVAYMSTIFESREEHLYDYANKIIKGLFRPEPGDKLMSKEGNTRDYLRSDGTIVTTIVVRYGEIHYARFLIVGFLISLFLAFYLSGTFASRATCF